MINNTDKDKLYAVCNLGSTEISVMIAKKMSNGCITPIAMDSEPSTHAIDKGCIHNIDETAEILRRIVDSVERQMPQEGKVVKMYVGINCRSLCSRSCESNLDLGEDGQIINTEHISTLRRQVDTAQFQGFHKVMVVDPKFFVDGKREVNPKGVKCKNIKAKYQIILVRKNIIDTIYETIEDRLGIKIAGILVNPIAEAHVSLTNEDFTLGSAYINIGGGITTVSIFKERLLASLFAIPMGGINVTKDIMSKNLLWRDAERLKVTKSSMDLSVDKELEVTILSQNGIGKKTLLQLDINSIVSARMVELLLNIFSLIKELGYDNDLAGGIIVGGGGSKIDGLTDYLHNIGAEFRMASIRRDILDESVEDKELSEKSTLLGLVAMSSENCVDIEPDNLEEMLFKEEQQKENDDYPKDYDDTLYTSSQGDSEIVGEDWLGEDDEETNSDEKKMFQDSKETFKRTIKNKKDKNSWFSKLWNGFAGFIEGKEE